jgi:hypothetical protein
MENRGFSPLWPVEKAAVLLSVYKFVMKDYTYNGKLSSLGDILFYSDLY